MEEIYMICEDSIEGVFTGIYDAYALKKGHEHIHLQIGEEENYRLFAHDMYIQPDSVKTRKVAETIQRRLGADVYMSICRALATEDEQKAQAVYKTVVDGITHGSGKRVLENMANPYVNTLFQLARSAGNEIHRMMEFLRFEELQQGILYAGIGPKCNIVSFLMPHFTDRLPLENFVIYDEKRNLYGVHPARKDWYLVSGQEEKVRDGLRMSDKEEEYQELFTMFCHTIAIKERKNLKLQQQMLPLRFQEYMVEFSKK
ncbi:MAG: TIGR03915 family putative DNA repair protein [Bacillus sp. (in: Bacteria)]|nr:TIGR03915 family putative DNA repair protein [Bacillus sp. (in: firmicutes)]MCM1427149.1 TIGR03915 family putative DNA repair protein [Eubacterium sp.]